MNDYKYIKAGDDTPFEITIYRVDARCDGRHYEVQFVRSLEEDIKRRFSV